MTMMDTAKNVTQTMLGRMVFAKTAGERRTRSGIARTVVKKQMMGCLGSVTIVTNFWRLVNYE
jgi:hypothetical protein